MQICDHRSPTAATVGAKCINLYKVFQNSTLVRNRLLESASRSFIIVWFKIFQSSAKEYQSECQTSQTDRNRLISRGFDFSVRPLRLTRVIDTEISSPEIGTSREAPVSANSPLWLTKGGCLVRLDLTVSQLTVWRPRLASCPKNTRSKIGAMGRAFCRRFFVVYSRLRTLDKAASDTAPRRGRQSVQLYDGNFSR